ncbi:hypothetical protein T439DRAFT_162634 [Meredithblackwellia eburnea MCA 4105]
MSSSSDDDDVIVVETTNIATPGKVMRALTPVTLSSSGSTSSKSDDDLIIEDGQPQAGPSRYFSPELGADIPPLSSDPSPKQLPPSRAAAETSTSKITIPNPLPSDFPLPSAQADFNISRHMPVSDPPKKQVGNAMQTEEIEEERRTRREEDRKMEGRDWDWRWTLECLVMPKNSRDKGKQKQPQRNHSYRDVAFFPYAQHPGLSHVRGVVAVVGGHQMLRLNSQQQVNFPG